MSGRQNRSLSVAWIDYKKAFDSVPHNWIIECLHLFNFTTFNGLNQVNVAKYAGMHNTKRVITHVNRARRGAVGTDGNNWIWAAFTRIQGQQQLENICCACVIKRRA